MCLSQLACCEVFLAFSCISWFSSTWLHFCCRPAVVRDTLLGAVATTLLAASDQVVSIYHCRIEHGYPTPSLCRDAVLSEALPWLQQHGIWSRGRFGSYKVGMMCCSSNILRHTEFLTAFSSRRRSCLRGPAPSSLLLLWRRWSR